MPFATLEICVAQVGSFVAFCRLFVNLCCDTAYFNAQVGFFCTVSKVFAEDGEILTGFCAPFTGVVFLSNGKDKLQMFCLLLRFLLAGAVGTHGIANWCKCRCYA